MTIHVQTEQHVQDELKAPTVPTLTQCGNSGAFKSRGLGKGYPGASEKGILGLRKGYPDGIRGHPGVSAYGYPKGILGLRKRGIRGISEGIRIILQNNKTIKTAYVS